ncbi:hypothetical protein [Alteromonas macleodii]|uniref:Uncharacterized protein n=1 Tax=Alteromonas macleodii TaxID=28108 RepID=A0AB36FLC8_ALTMA|nr:hypothetical protein [Alteromonas macleodii]OES23922.1 hypothetical protein BFV94_4970 [Alteromonas macleodii]OES24100.1 hypothetical protein BFV93_4853 [Alteromonas macleodii]OES25027.1 hypothetical protein BFV95_4495 [Alteromonas macleodii]OES38705.1 hypothetical protein BFV96_4816 [Alteromonas macleodii]
MNYELAEYLDSVSHVLFFVWCAYLINSLDAGIGITLTSILLIAIGLSLALQVVVERAGIRLFRWFAHDPMVEE